MRPAAPLAVLAVLTLARPLAAERLALARPGAEVALERTGTGRLSVPVEITGERMVWALDTGATMTMIAASLARRLALRATVELAVTDVTGRVRPALAGGPIELRLGGVPLRLAEVGWFPGGDGDYELEGLGGVLAADALPALDVALDAGEGRARFAPAGALAGWFDGAAVPLATIAGRPALEVQLRDLGRRPVTVRLVLDSGADRPILFGELARRLASIRAASTRTGELASAHATSAVDFAMVGRGTAGGNPLRLGRAALLPALESRQEDGLLPLAALGPVLLESARGRALLGARLRAAPRPEPGTLVALVR